MSTEKQDKPVEISGMGFETALEELEGLVSKMEEGSMNLDVMVDAFERGQKLVKHCTAKLNEVEKRIELLVKGDDGEPTTRPLDPPELPL